MRKEASTLEFKSQKQISYLFDLLIVLTFLKISGFNYTGALDKVWIDL